MAGAHPEMPFNQLSIPVELKLKGSGASAVLTRQPVGVDALRGKAIVHENTTIRPGKPFVQILRRAIRCVVHCVYRL